jgi:steroid delta-isomerase-like uncharacterized protein
VTQEIASGEQALAVAEDFIAAYNAKDFQTLERVLASDLVMRHHNRDVELIGAESALSTMHSFESAFPDRRFHSIRRRLAVGEHAIVEHTWEATATVDVPGFAAAGEVARMELCTVFTIRNGQIVEYDDYG